MSMKKLFKLFSKTLWQRIYRFYGVRRNVRLGRNVHIGVMSILWAPSELVVKDNVYIGKCCTIECDGVIGNDVLIANNVGLIGRYDHDYRSVGRAIRRAPWVGDPDYAGLGKGLYVIIGDDVWIGFGAVILTGVKVGRGAIVSAGAVVAKEVDPYAIVAGNPARKIGERFRGDEIVQHEKLLYGRVVTAV